MTRLDALHQDEKRHIFVAAVVAFRYPDPHIIQSRGPFEYH